MGRIISEEEVKVRTLWRAYYFEPNWHSGPIPITGPEPDGSIQADNAQAALAWGREHASTSDETHTFVIPLGFEMIINAAWVCRETVAAGLKPTAKQFQDLHDAFLRAGGRPAYIGPYPVEQQ